ncbi:similar to stage IV sporulation protein [Desulfonispora thiosulfatigenes DSM 11270]|uniref:Similar to stage IV sporulation protein n=1 Tax=Desulfonispora thiosulfatigenes DSM 11270 TaxID=656914 RepID=A0A1W1VCC7_DESTI|nr:sporulation protein YqfD [Desulfonispora thiosulfatigenes]SMB90975.1 similar to stage IV sporulation protein [Desulfonispora thiosulfatigenes DSM 11270]
MGWYSYFMGYLIIIIEGDFPEKVINMALTRGILLWDIKAIENNKIMLKVKIPGFRALRHIVKHNGCRMKIHKKVGMPFKLSWIKRRKGLIYGSVIFFISLYILSSFVWFIEITGMEKIKESEINDLALQYGIRRGANINSLDLDKLEIEMAENHPGIAWVGLDREGTKISIKIAEKSLIPKTEDHKKGHLIALEDGIIEEMLILQGTPLVQEGDTVKKGQMLVSGYIYPEIIVNDDGTQSFDGDPELVKAKGVVRAVVDYKQIGSCPLEKDTYIKTGETIEQIIVKFKNKNIVIKGPKEVNYKYYIQTTKSKNIMPWRNKDNSVEFISQVYYEQNKKKIQYGHEEAFKEAIKKAEKELGSKFKKDIEVVEKEVNLLPGDSNIVKVEVTWKCVHNIAKNLVAEEKPQNKTEQP